MSKRMIVSKDWLKTRLIFKSCPVCGGHGMIVGWENSIKDCKRCEGSGRISLTNHECGAVLGKALLAIFNCQTADEKSGIATKYKNGVGFSGPDARLGTLGAQKFLAHGTLPPWLVKIWLVEKNGYPRICKYAKQLNQIANERKAQTQTI